MINGLNVNYLTIIRSEHDGFPNQIKGLIRYLEIEGRFTVQEMKKRQIERKAAFRDP